MRAQARSARTSIAAAAKTQIRNPSLRGLDHDNLEMAYSHVTRVPVHRVVENRYSGIGNSFKKARVIVGQ